jgi:hypothetical protein
MWLVRRAFGLHHDPGAAVAQRPASLRLLIVTVVLTVAPAAVVSAQGRTDVVILSNGDHITGEVVTLDRGRLEFKTDDAGTLYLEWDKLTSVVTTRFVEVVAEDGRRFFGSLAKAADRTLNVAGSDVSEPLPMSDVALIRTLGRGFWAKVDGTIDAGYNYTRSSGVAQLNVNSDTVYRQPAAQTRLTASATITEKNDDSGRDDRGSVEGSYLRYPWQHVFVIGAVRFESNESVGIKLRSQVGAATGPRLINTNRAQLAMGGGVVFNDEQGVDVEPTQNVEGLLILRTSYYTYDRPRTNLDVNIQYYPSLSNIGRHRLQVDAGVKRELWKDFFASLNFYNTFDSRPPNPSAEQNDVGFVFSLGWSY